MAPIIQIYHVMAMGCQSNKNQSHPLISKISLFLGEDTISTSGGDAAFFMVN
jgi:hypothetical protein